MSRLERLWLVAERVAAPFVNQLVLEADEGDLSATDWPAALSQAAAATPGATLRLRGVLGWTRWTAGGAPAVREVDGSAWSGRDGGGAPFLARPLDGRAGPPVELLVVRGPRPRLVLRTAHALMDGGGARLLAERIAAAARGEELPPPRFAPLTDEALARELGGSPSSPPPGDCPSPLGSAASAPLAVRWARRTLPVAGRRLLPRLIQALAAEVPAPERATVRVDVPVDLRRHRPELALTANLTGLLRVPAGSLLAEDEPVEAIATWITDALARKDEVAFPLSAPSVRWLPLGLLARAARGKNEEALAAGRFSTTATVSNLGRMDLPAFAAPGFTPRRAFWIPPGSPGLPLFLTATGGGDGVELCASAPLALADGGRLEGLLDRLCSTLSA